MLVAHLLSTAALWVRSRHFSKIQNRRHKQRSGQHTLARQKNTVLKKIKNYKHWWHFLFSHKNFLGSFMRSAKSSTCMSTKGQTFTHPCHRSISFSFLHSCLPPPPLFLTFLGIPLFLLFFLFLPFILPAISPVQQCPDPRCSSPGVSQASVPPPYGKNVKMYLTTTEDCQNIFDNSGRTSKYIWQQRENAIIYLTTTEERQNIFDNGRTSKYIWEHRKKVKIYLTTITQNK